MKIIEVSDDMYEKLVALGNEMTSQDARGTRMPHMFQIRTKKKVYDWGLNGEFKIWVGDYQEEIETYNDYIEYLDNNGIEYPVELKELWEDGTTLIFNSDEYHDIEDFISEYTTDLKECSYSSEDVYHNHFLTAKACQEHIKLNSYHYNEPVDYLNHAWRNPEMDLVSEFLCGLVNKPMHT